MEKFWADLDGWVKALGALGAFLGVLAVPFSGTLKEWWGYRLRRMEIEKLSTSPAEAVKSIGPETIGLSMLGSDLLKAAENIHKAITDLAAAIREDTESDEKLNNERLTGSLHALLERIEAMDLQREGHGRRR